MADKILIVDDDPNTVEFLSLILAKQGYQMVVAREGMQALSMAHSEKPDLIILDVMMPGLDGYEVARSLRRHPDTAVIPILMFTAKTQIEDKLAGYEAGVDIYLTKPVHPVDLNANIKALLLQKKARSKVAAEKGYVIGIVAAKGGLGVSTVALNLAITYHKKTNARVIAAELKPGQGSWSQDLDLPFQKGLCQLLCLSPAEITGTIVEDRLTSTPYGIRLLLSSNQYKDVEYISAAAQFEAVVQQLAMLASFVTLDIGTSFLPAYEMILEQCNEILVITEPQPSAVKRTHLLINELKAKGYGSSKPLTVIIVNRYRADMQVSVSQIESIIKQPVALGFPPSAELAYRAAEQSAPICLIQPESMVAQQFNALSDQIARHISP
ncbi:MAG: response regulator [Omnitrophica WOR_2 bacterium]